jgi:hypothetical protein
MASCPLIPTDWDIPQVVRFRLGDHPGRQRAMQHEGHLLLVLHDVPQRHDRERIRQLFWRNPEGQWRSTLGVGGEQSVEVQIDTFAAAIERMTEAFNKTEQSIGYFDILGALGPIRRSIRNLHATLQEARELEPEERLIIIWRDQAYDLVRRAELLYNDAQAALNFESARQAEAQAQASQQRAVAAHRLNMLAAFFFPLATISTILSMKLRHGLEDWEANYAPWVFAGVLATGVLIGVVLTYVITRPARRPKIERTTEDE